MSKDFQNKDLNYLHCKMIQKLLVISPTPTHPQNAGNRARIFSFVEQAKTCGLSIYFLYVNMEGDPNEEMKTYWGDNLYVLGTNKYPNIEKPRTYKERILRKVGLINNEQYRYNYHLDDWFDDGILTYCKGLQTKISFDFVLTEYIFMSKALTVFPKKTIKIIDTHDCFTDRYKVYPLLDNGLRSSKWFSTYKYDEKRGLNRADRIVAIQGNEANYFRKLTSKPVFTIGHLFEDLIHKNTNIEPNQKMLIFGSDNPINVDGYRFFVNNIWPLIQKKLPTCELVVAGLICGAIEHRADITYLGILEDKADAYKNIAIAINPMTYGSGLKIKTLEALIYGVPVVSTTHGALGLEDMIEKCIFVSDNPEVFSKYVCDLFTNKILYQNTLKSVFECSVAYKSMNDKSVKELFANNMSYGK